MGSNGKVIQHMAVAKLDFIMDRWCLRPESSLKYCW